jgi:hypothetical protein
VNGFALPAHIALAIVADRYVQFDRISAMTAKLHGFRS